MKFLINERISIERYDLDATGANSFTVFFFFKLRKIAKSFSSKYTHIETRVYHALIRPCPPVHHSISFFHISLPSIFSYNAFSRRQKMNFTHLLKLEEKEAKSSRITI